METAGLIFIALIAGAVGLRVLRNVMRSAWLMQQVPPRFLPLIDFGIKWTIIFGVLVAVMRAAGITVDSIIASVSAFLLVGTVALFAYWSVLSNALCAILLLLLRPFRIGDFIEVRENKNSIVASGRVTGINLAFVTLTKKADNTDEDIFRIPSNLFFQRTIRVSRGEETTSLGQAFAEDRFNKDVTPKDNAVDSSGSAP